MFQLHFYLQSFFFLLISYKISIIMQQMSKVCIL